jgi:uncharacterized protein (DUF2384 family)
MLKIDQDLFDRVARALGSREKARTWFDAPNPMLGGASPVEMIKQGLESRLRRFVEEALPRAH